MKLNEFNRLLADYVLPVFPSNVCPFQDKDETLLFRGPIPNSDDREYIGCHVSVDLDKEVRDVLSLAEPAKRLEMMENLKRNLGMQIRLQYSSNRVGQNAKKFNGTMELLAAYDE